jgi:GABA(A) receptor-associated protein
MEYKQQLTNPHARRAEAERLLLEHPTKVPTIIEPGRRKDNRYSMAQNKFLILREYSFQEFSQLLRNKLKLKANDSLYLIAGDNVIPTPDQSIARLYESCRDTDGFLYITYASQETFG